MKKRIAIIGGGITGLSAAYRLQELDADCEIHLFESADRCGGVLGTTLEKGFLVEHSADMFTTREPAALELCRKIGFEDQLIETNRENRRAWIAWQGEVLPIPRGLNLMSPTDLSAIEETPLLSGQGKARFLREQKIPPLLDVDDESLHDFAIRRFGVEAYERIIQPLVGGIYTADPRRLSLNATMPQYLQMEQKHGSIIRALESEKEASAKETDLLTADNLTPHGSGATSGARYNLFVAPRNGMQSLLDALLAQLDRVEFRIPKKVERVLSSRRNCEVQFSHEEDVQTEEFDGVIFAIPADRIAKTLVGVLDPLTLGLELMDFASSVVAIHGVKKEQIKKPVEGFGIVVPLVENRRILATSFSSQKFAGRAPDDSVLIRTFIGGGCQPELNRLQDSELLKIARKELADLIGLEGPPVLEKTIRWQRAMPQYHVGHRDLVTQITQLVAETPKIAVAGKCYAGVGIPACVQSGTDAAENILTKV